MNILWIFIIIVVLVILKVLFDIKETFLPEYLSHKTKSFDAEKEARLMYGNEGAWKSNPTKSFDSESQGVAMNGLSGGFIGKTIKYY